MDLGCLVDDPRDREHVPTVRALCRDAYFATLDRRHFTVVRPRHVNAFELLP